MDLTRNPEYVGGSLLNYFLGTARRLFNRDLYVGPLAEEPPAFYAYVTKTRRNLAEQLPRLEVSEVAPSKICEQLATAQLTKQQQ